MAEAARNRDRVASIVFGSFRFLCLVVLPVHIGAAIISKQAITLAYGAQYLPAVWPMMITAALGIPRAFQNLPDTLMRAADRQYDLIRCMIITGMVNIAVDFILIPHHGAVGAAIGNGVAQSFGVVLLWSTRSQDVRVRNTVEGDGAHVGRHGGDGRGGVSIIEGLPSRDRAVRFHSHGDSGLSDCDTNLPRTGPARLSSFACS